MVLTMHIAGQGCVLKKNKSIIILIDGIMLYYLCFRTCTGPVYMWFGLDPVYLMRAVSRGYAEASV